MGGDMRYLSVICAFAAGLACGVTGPMLVARHDLTLVEPRTEAIGILEDEVMSVTFMTDKMTFAAQRSKPGAAFAVQVTYADGKPSRQCQVSSNLAGQLAAYATITTKRQLHSQRQAQKDFPIKVGTLELRDRMEDEPLTVIRWRASSDRKALAALYANVAVEVTNPESAFTNLERACTVLTGKVSP